jgi:hypothetical protein
MYINTLRTGDANLRFLRYDCERQMMQICLLTRAWFLHIYLQNTWSFFFFTGPPVRMFKKT